VVARGVSARVLQPEPRRGQVWWARVDKRQPVLLLSRNRVYSVRRRALVAEISRHLRHNDATVELGPRDGLPERCIVNAENLIALSLNDLVEYVTTLTPARMLSVCGAIAFATGCD
jgi:mRNA interferase MazF